MDWINIKESGLPPKREHPYKVVVSSKKKHDERSVYAGQGRKSVAQDWVVRNNPENFTDWFEIVNPY